MARVQDHAGREVPADHCTGRIGARTVAEVQVPAGEVCRLVGTTVSGDVSIGSGGRLVARHAQVGGDVDGRGARRVWITSRSLIAGSLTLAQGGSSTISHAEIHADLRWVMQTGHLTVRRTLVQGDLIVDRNGGGVILAGNRVGGDLLCHQNLRIPIRGANVVAGHREGQCASSALRPVGRNVTRDPRRSVETHTDRVRPPCAGDSVSDDPSDDECGDD